MILYRLRCSNGHEFEGWFNNAEAFDAQAKSCLVSCPECADTTVTKALMAPAIGRSVERTPPMDMQREAVAPDAERKQVIAQAIPDSVRAGLQKLRALVESQCENVGERFAEEAMKRHRAERDDEPAGSSGIYGTMTSAERDALEEEGIDFATLPWIDRADA